MSSLYVRLNWNPTTKVVALETSSSSAPAALGGAYTGTAIFTHGDVDTLPGTPNVDDNHVLYNHVQAEMYKLGVQNMQDMKIYIDKARSISIGSGTVTVAHGADATALTVTPTPANANAEVIYSSSDTTKATVNALGVIHGVAAGSAVITATLKSDNTKTATRNVTVT